MTYLQLLPLDLLTKTMSYMEPQVKITKLKSPDYGYIMIGIFIQYGDGSSFSYPLTSFDTNDIKCFLENKSKNLYPCESDRYGDPLYSYNTQHSLIRTDQGFKFGINNFTPSESIQRLLFEELKRKFNHTG